MKIPESIRVGGIEYLVKSVENLNDGQRMLCGQIDHCKTEIRLDTNISHNGIQFGEWRKVWRRKYVYIQISILKH